MKVYNVVVLMVSKELFGILIETYVLISPVFIHVRSNKNTTF